MSTPVGVDLDLDASGYTEGAQQISVSSAAAGAALSGLAVAHRTVTAQLGSGLPGKAAFAGFIAAAADAQQQFSGLRAQQVLTGQSAKTLEGSVKSLAGAFPVGQAGALSMVRTLQQLGLSGSNQTAQVGALAKGFIQLGGATGESATGLASMQIQLSRLYGNLDPSRVMKMNDSLVTVAATSGASASAVLSFSNAIGPLAKAAGLGQTAVMGISAQMASLGQDGGGAATALNKVFSDLNQSVVTGSSQLQTYARIVGMTTAQFKSLYQSDPSKAIENVTNALAAPGAQGQRNLQELGFDGVRTQVSLQALSQSGGLTNAINTAVGAYGNGKTAAASAQTFNTLEGDLAKLGSAAEVVAQNLGGPFLSVSAKVTSAFTELLKPLQAITGSSAVRGALGVAGYALPVGAAALGAGKLLGEGGVLAQLYNSGPVSSARLGRAAAAAGLDDSASPAELQAAVVGMYKPGRRRQGALSMIDPNGGGVREQGVLKSLNTNAYAAALGYGQPDAEPSEEQVAARAATAERVAAVRSMTPSQLAAMPGGSGSTSWRKRLSNMLGTGIRGYASMVAGPMYNASLDPAVRARVDPSSGIADADLTEDELTHRENMRAISGPQASQARGLMTGGLRGIGGALRSGDMDALRAGTSDFGTGLGSYVGASNGLLRSSTAAATQLATSGTKLIGTLGKSLGSMAAANPLALGVGLGVPLATYGIDKFEHRNDDWHSQEDTIKNGDIYATLNAYSDALGKAGIATTSFAQIAQNSALAMQKTTGSTVTGAKTVTAADVTAGLAENLKTAQGRLGKGITSKDSASAIAAQLNNAAVGGIDTQSAQQMKLDLLRLTGGDQATVQSVLNQLNVTDPTQTSLVPSKRSVGQLFTGVQGALAADSSDPLADKPKNAPKGQKLYKNLNDADIAAYSGALQGAGQNEQINAAAYGQVYASQQQVRQVSALYSKTYNAVGAGLNSSGNQRLVQLAAQAIDPSFKAPITEADMTRANGNLAVAMGYASPAYQKVLNNLLGEGASVGSSGGLAPVFQASPETTALASTESPLAQFFTNDPAKNATGVAAKINAAYTNPDNESSQVGAADALITKGTAMGMSFEQISNAAIKMSSHLDSASQYLGSLNLVLALTATKAQADVAGDDTGQQINQQAQTAQTYYKASLVPNNPNASDQAQTAATSFASAKTNAEQQYDQILTSYRSYLISRQRSQIQFGTSETRAAQDYGIQVFQANQDNQEQILRSTQDYQEQALRSTQDYQTQRMRSTQDFYLQMSRTVQDAEKTLYDPYQRIQAAPVFDAGTLLANLGNQAKAMTQQVTNLKQIEAMGLSQSAIAMLSLSSTSEAQQLQELIQNAQSDPAVIAQLNKAAGTRLTNTTALVENPANTDYTRQVQDFNTSQNRAAQDFSLSMTRQTQDFDKSMTRQAQDFTKEMDRQAESYQLQRQRSIADYQLSLNQAAQDFANTENVIGGNLESLTIQIGRMLNGQTVQWTDITENNVNDIAKTVKDFASQFGLTFTGAADGTGTTGLLGSLGKAFGSFFGSLTSGIDKAVGGSGGGGIMGVLDDLVSAAGGGNSSGSLVGHATPATKGQVATEQQYAEAMLGEYGWDKSQMPYLIELWNQESGWNSAAQNPTSTAYGIAQFLDSTWKSYGAKTSDWKTQINYGLEYISQRYGSPQGAWAHEVADNWYATGSIFTGPQTIGVGEAGPEAVLPLNSNGAAFLAKVFSQALSMDDMRMLSTSVMRSMGSLGASMSSTSNDYTQSFAGASIQVVATNPADMLSALQRQERRDALTAGRR